MAALFSYLRVLVTVLTPSCPIHAGSTPDCAQRTVLSGRERARQGSNASGYGQHSRYLGWVTHMIRKDGIVPAAAAGLSVCWHADGAYHLTGWTRRAGSRAPSWTPSEAGSLGAPPGWWPAAWSVLAEYAAGEALLREPRRG